MNNFSFMNQTRILFGKGMEEAVGEQCAAYGRRVLLHYGGGSIVSSGLYDRVRASLQSAGLEVEELGGVKPNPRLSLVREGIEICHSRQIDLILAVGGGSVIDSAKAIGIGFFHDGDVWDFYSGLAAPQKMLPVGTVLTIPAAGSEASNSSVITNEQAGLKRGVGAECMRPVFSILNPELTFTLPEYQSACGVSDMLAHVMERYFTPTSDVRLSDNLCEAVMRVIVELGPRLMKQPHDYQIRAEIMWAGTMAHNDIIGLGRDGDWSSHMIEHEISAYNDLAHGAGLSIVFPAWMKYVYKVDIRRFVRFAERVFGIAEIPGKEDETALKGIAALEDFYRRMLLPTRLSEVDVDKSGIAEMAEKAVAGGDLGAFCKLNRDDVAQILELAL